MEYWDKRVRAWNIGVDEVGKEATCSLAGRQADKPVESRPPNGV